MAGDLAVVPGYLNGYFPYRFPLVIGKDFAGEVDSVSPDVTDYAPGDRVFGVVTKPFLREGSFAEYLTAPTAVGLAKLPDSVSFTEGAALGPAGATAHTEEEKDLVTRLGADTTIDHTGADVVARTRELSPDGVDVVFHLAGDQSSVEALRPGGRFVSLLVVSPEQVPATEVEVVPIAADPTPELLERIAADHATGATALTVQQASFVARTSSTVVERPT